jgi:hypothetical protein
MKSYDGSLFFSAKHNWLLLKDARGAMVGRRGIKPTDSFSLGSKISFPNHVIRMGSAWPVILKNSGLKNADSVSSSNLDHSLSADNSGVSSDEGGEEVHSHHVDDQVLPSSAVFDAISMKLDFSYGHKFKDEIKRKFGSTVHPLGKSNHFLLVVSFGRATFKLHEDAVGIALESCIGGNCDDLAVKFLNDRVFRFSVSSKAVGFMVNALRSFSCSSFKCYFHLWSNGGPYWHKEFLQWQADCDKEWILVSPNKGRTDKALAALHTTPQKSALRARQFTASVKKKLTFAEEVAYPACPGYVAANPTSSQIEFNSDKVIIAENIIKAGQNFDISFGTTSYQLDNCQGQIHSVNNGSESTVRPNLDAQTTAQARCDLDGLEDVIDDIAYRFWECGRCLSMGHNSMDCTRDIRCRTCFNYGHKEKSCLIWLTKKGKSGCPNW